jgi:hypothetical protein
VSWIFQPILPAIGLLATIAPSLTTAACTDLAVNSATGNGNITATGGENATRRGFCYMAGTSGDPTTADSVVYEDGNYGAGAYTLSISGLSAGSSYRVRAYAVNSAGTGYGTTVQLATATTYTKSADLNALVQKTGITALASLNAILANVTRLDRIADVALSGTPRVCITHSHYFKVFPTRAGSETPAGDRDAWKTYDDSALSGTPKRIGFAYAGELYWAKGYPTPAATANPTADIVQNMAFAVSDDTVSGEPAVFRILSGGNYYYFKAYLDSVLQVQELYVNASLDAVLALAATTHTATALLDALIQKQAILKTASLDARLQKSGLTGTTGLNALIRKDGVTRGGSLDALLASVHSVSGSLDALIQKQAIPKTASLDARLQKAGLTGATGLNALIRKDGVTRGGSLDALLAGFHPVTASLDARLQKQGILKTASLDARLQKTIAATASIDALLKKVGLIKVVGLDSLLKKTGIEAAAGIDALLSSLTTSMAYLDTLLQKTIATTAKIDVLIQRQDITGGAAMDAILLEGMRDLPLQYCRTCKILYFMDESERCPKCGWIPGSSMTSPAMTQSIDISPAGEMPAEGGVIAGALADLPLCVCRNCGMGFLLDGQMDGEMECCPRCGWTPGKTETYTETYTEKGDDYAEI